MSKVNCVNSEEKEKKKKKVSRCFKERGEGTFTINGEARRTGGGREGVNGNVKIAWNARG